MRTSFAIARLLALVVICIAVTGCDSFNRAVKPKAARTSAFLSHGKDLRADPHSPFSLNWTNSSRSVQSAARQRNEIWIAPVSLQYLRPISKLASKVESNDAAQKAGARQLAALMHTEFVDAFRKSPHSRYRLANRPNSKAVVLELALVELNPNSISAGMFRTALNVAAVPWTDALVGRSFKGTIAIEGKLRDYPTKNTLLEFADNEESKSTFLLSFRDFTRYGQAQQAIGEWAAQFEQLTRTPPNGKVNAAPQFTILPW